MSVLCGPGLDRVRGEMLLLCKNESRTVDQNRHSGMAQHSTVLQLRGESSLTVVVDEGGFFLCFFTSASGNGYEYHV